MTPEEIIKLKAEAQAKASELASEEGQNGRKKYMRVHCVFVQTKTELVTAFLKEPPYLTKMTAINLMIADKAAAGEMILNASLIEGASDDRFKRPLEEPTPETANIYINGCLAALALLNTEMEIDVKKN